MEERGRESRDRTQGHSDLLQAQLISSVLRAQGGLEVVGGGGAGKGEPAPSPKPLGTRSPLFLLQSGKTGLLREGRMGRGPRPCSPPLAKFPGLGGLSVADSALVGGRAQCV